MTDIEELKKRLRSDDATQAINVGSSGVAHTLSDSSILDEAADTIESLQRELERQAKAAKMGMDAAKQSAQAMLIAANKARAESSPDALASERAANAELTAQVERLQRELVSKTYQLQRELEEARRDAERPSWESTTPAYTKYITDSKYQKLRPAYQKWYRPICQCAAKDSLTPSA